MIYAGLMDLVTLRIRNTLVIAIGGAWLVLAPLSGFTLAELSQSAAVGAGVLAVTFTFFALGWIGGGDAKLAAVTALWFAPYEALQYFAFASVLGGILTLVIVQLRTGVVPLFFYRVPWIAQLHDSRAGVPYGAAMAPAALIIFPETAWVAHALS
jgi:prepilin peptidase CpaA